MLQLGAMEGHSLFLCLRGQPRSLRMPLFKKGCQGWRFCSVAHSDVNLWQRVCLYVHVCLCCLTSRSTLHLPHWFGPCTHSPPPPPPHITSWQNDSPLWPIETPNTQSFAQPIEVAINPPAPTPQDSWPTGLSHCYETPVIFFPPCAAFSLIPHPKGSILHHGLSELLKCLDQLSSKAKKKRKEKKRTWSKDAGWM